MSQQRVEYIDHNGLWLKVAATVCDSGIITAVDISSAAGKEKNLCLGNIIKPNVKFFEDGVPLFKAETPLFGMVWGIIMNDKDLQNLSDFEDRTYFCPNNKDDRNKLADQYLGLVKSGLVFIVSWTYPTNDPKINRSIFTATTLEALDGGKIFF